FHDVWASNVEDEFNKMRTLNDCPYVAMDTEFPGVAATPLGQFKSKVGFALVNDKGELSPSGDESVDMLRHAGTDFDRLQTDGISIDFFGELLTTSGVIVDDRITWITFPAGYDFGYLFKTISLKKLPDSM
ncbi:hypothetical protein PRIPAC_96047, partial [Pristionchus pacificus]|uniref:Uncharacterized protein n=1 Tax=Pristionchus pacificus TaxID=54126 RepID=A0A2A6BJW1_PRIPA